MKSIYRFILRHNQSIYKGAMFLAGILLIVYIFPREGKFRYEFQKGKPWMHDALIAPYDFPIYKSEAELTAERDSIMKLFKPYFFTDTTVVQQKISEFNRRFDEAWGEYVPRAFGVNDTAQLPQSSRLRKTITGKMQEYLQEGSDLLTMVYDRGIVSVPEVFSRVQNTSGLIVVMKGKIAQDVSFSGIFTQKTAYEYLTDRLEASDPGQGLEEAGIRFYRNLNMTEFIAPNIFFDEATTEKIRQSLLAGISLTKGMIQEGVRIISRGDVVGNREHRILESMKIEYEKRIGAMASRFMIIAGQFLLVFVSFVVIFLFLLNFRKEILQHNLKLAFVLFMVVSFVMVAALTLRFSQVSIYILPLAILPIIIRTFYDARLALFIHLITMLIIGFLAPNSFEFVFLSIIAGIVAIFSLTNIYRRGKLFLTAALITLSYALAYTGIGIIQEGNLSNVRLLNYVWFAANGGLILLTYPLIYLFEKAFGFLSDATLVEMSDTNQPLLRRLAETAPGSFQHSLQVANLAEGAANRIGANVLLVRAGALYHDIGKMETPMYFIENQAGGINPHDKLEFEESARIIIGHVGKGVETARRYKLPAQLVDFIRTHHGTTRVQYFYQSFIKKFPENAIETNKFSYPGPKPFSREMAILMMADSVEAASRSLKNISRGTLDELVDRIIDYQVSQQQFDNADITFRDIHQIREVLKERLSNIYHARVEYPRE